MKRTSEIRSKGYLGRALMLMAVCVALILGAAPGQAATVGELFKFLPQDAQVAIGIPDIAAVEKAGAPLLALPMLADAAMLGVQLGGDTLAEGLTNSGINANAPGAVFLQMGAGNNPLVAGVLLVSDADQVKETLLALLGSEGSALPLPGDLEGRFVSASGVGYFMVDDRLFLASTQGLLEQLAGRIGSPAEVNYGKDGPKDEVVVFSRIDTIEQSNLMMIVPQLAMLKPVLDTLKPFSDEVIFAIGEEAGNAYVRLAARNIDGAVAAPAPLGLHGYMDPEAPVLLNLRLTPELINAVSMVLMNQPDTRQAGGIVRIAGGMLDDELAVSFAGMKSEDVPDAVIAVTMKSTAAVPNLLRMLAKIEEPSYQLDGTDVYVYEDVTDGTDLHIATAANSLVVTPGEDALKTTMERFSGAAGAAGVNRAIVNRGVYGFLMIDGAKATNLPPGLLPANINLSDVNLAMTMGVDGEWREVVLTSPAGFAGIALILSDLL